MGQQSGPPAGREARAPHAQLGALAYPGQGAPAGSLLQPAHAPPVSRPRGPSARVVDVEVESLVAQQGVRVVELQEVDALAGVVVAASLHVSVAVPAVHGHDLPVAAPQGAPGASLHVSSWDGVCVSKGKSVRL